jgi:hypothetical protein
MDFKNLYHQYFWPGSFPLKFIGNLIVPFSFSNEGYYDDICYPKRLFI